MGMDVKLEQSWKEILKDEFGHRYFQELAEFVKSEYKRTTVFPPPKLIFAAFDACPIEQVKVVILGQDPYHGPGQANGLAFSVNDGVAVPPSLINIYKEIETDLGKPRPKSGNLERWAKQGVMLLNATLTVRAHQAGSHQKKGWEEFTDKVVNILNQHRNNLVFMLWGAYAQKKGQVIDTNRHLVLKAPHPSPLSAHTGFLGCKHFSKANDYLWMNGIEPVEW